MPVQLPYCVPNLPEIIYQQCAHHYACWCSHQLATPCRPGLLCAAALLNTHTQQLHSMRFHHSTCTVQALPHAHHHITQHFILSPVVMLAAHQSCCLLVGARSHAIQTPEWLCTQRGLCSPLAAQTVHSRDKVTAADKGVTP